MLLLEFALLKFTGSFWRKNKDRKITMVMQQKEHQNKQFFCGMK